MTIDLGMLDATAQAELVARRELSALELVEAALARIARVDPQLHAVASIDADGARARARGPLSGPLAGVPMLAKDLLNVSGQPCTFGCRLFAHNVAVENAPFAQRLLDAGLVIVGKSTTSEFGMLGSTETLLHGVTHNPYDPARSATGSSGGSAAAVAAGLVPLAHASDAGGSIRLPAAAQGLFGFKPSRRRHVPAGPDDMNGMLSEHVVTRSVRDSALVLTLVADARADLPPLHHVRGPATRRLRIAAYADTLFGEQPSSEVRAAHVRAIALCRELGHTVEEVGAPQIDARGLSDAFFLFGGLGLSALADQLAPMVGHPLGEGELEPFTLALIARARRADAAAVARAQAVVERARSEMAAFLARADVTLCPTTPDSVPLLGELAPTRDYDALIGRTERFAGYTAIHNTVGAPAMSVPLYCEPSGLPIGSHFAAPVGEDERLLALAYELEAAAPWALRRPPLHA
jgi:amidase